jgi:hypothetical protein
MIAKLLVPLVAAVVAAPSANAIYPLQAFKTLLPKVQSRTTVAVLLPAKLPTAGRTPKLYASGFGIGSAWSLSLAGAPNCGNANACFIAAFNGQRGRPLPIKSNLKLANGDAAAYHPISCGASCAPATLWFVHQGVLYTWQLKDAPKGARSVLMKAAAAAIAAGPR